MQNLLYTYRLIYYSSLTKIWNLVLLKYSFIVSRILKRAIIFGKPAFYSIEPTNACNLLCPECPTGNKSSKRIKSNINPNLYNSIIKDIKNTCFHVNLFFQGEPYLHESIFDFITIAHRNRIFTYISTNGHYLDEVNADKTVVSKLDKITISLDGPDYQTYKKYRINGNFDTVIEGITNLVKSKKKYKSKFPIIEIQCLLLSTTQNQITQFKEYAYMLGADKVIFKTAQFYDLEHGSALMPDGANSRYKQNNDGTFEIKKKLKPYCWRMWSNPVITSNGDLIPCCFDKHTSFVQGNFSNQSISKIWKKEQYNSFRNVILQNRNSIEICRNCTS